MAIVYLITNITNGKLYIGFTKRSRERRLAEHMYDSGKGSPNPLHAAIRKYGPAAFTIITLGSGNIPEMLAMERAKIAELSTLAPVGYNLNDGGTARTKYTNTTRAKMSASAKARAASEDRTEQLAKATQTRWARPGARDRAGAKRRGWRKPGKAARDQEIRIRYVQGGVSQKALGARYGLTQAMIWRIIWRKG